MLLLLMGWVGVGDLPKTPFWRGWDGVGNPTYIFTYIYLFTYIFT